MTSFKDNQDITRQVHPSQTTVDCRRKYGRRSTQQRYQSPDFILTNLLLLMFVEGRRIKSYRTLLLRKVRRCLIFTTKTPKWSAKLKKKIRTEKVLIFKANNINFDFDTKWIYPETSGDVPSGGGRGQLDQRLQVRRESARPRLCACGVWTIEI